MNRVGVFALNTAAVLAGGVAGAVIGGRKSSAEGAIIGAGIGNAIVWSVMLAFPGTNSPTSPAVGTSGPCWTNPRFP